MLCVYFLLIITRLTVKENIVRKSTQPRILYRISKMWRVLLTIASVLAMVEAHGRVIQPASRASAWRAGFPTKPDYDDDGVNCGGMWHQWSYNKGKCGICGDRYDAKPPRAHELGGIFGEGIIVAHYLPASVFTVTVHLTTSHKGFWEFKLCPDPHRNDQDCFDDYPLELEEGGTKYYPTRGSVKYDVNYRLPSGLVCDHCVLQWRYTAGNNWGICPNGTGGLGCGNQEQFGACSDVSIGVGKHGFKPQKPEGYDDMPSVLLHYLSKGYYDLQDPSLKEVVPAKSHSKTKSPSIKNKLKRKKQRKNKKRMKFHKQKKMQFWR